MGTPLCEATMCGHGDAVELLLKNGADVNKQNRYGFIALHFACTNGHGGMVRLLLSYGSDMYVYDRSRRLPIEHAVTYDVICAGFDLDYLQKSGGSLLHITGVLSAKCKDVDVYHMVAAKGMLNTVKYLYDMCKDS